MQSVKEAGKSGLEVIIDFIHNKYGKLLDLNITTLIFFFFFSFRKHWNIHILENYNIFTLIQWLVLAFT